MTKFESFESVLYAAKIKETVKYIFSDYLPINTVLDFCCGDGTGTDAIHKMGFEVIGFDGNHNKIQLAKKHHPGLKFFQMEVSDIHKIHNTYDIIYASHCFEHFLHPMALLMKARKELMNDGGVIILILPYPNEECEGHPGSNILCLNKGIEDIVNNFSRFGFQVHRIEQMNFREPELLIILQ